MSVNKIEENTNKLKDILGSQFGRIDNVKMSMIQCDLQIQCNPSKNNNGIFHRKEKKQF